MNTQQPDTEQWLSLSAAAKRLNVHPTTLRRWADDGEIAVMLTPGGHRRFALTDVEQFAQSRHGLRRSSGIEQAWADHALTVTRQEIVAHRNVAWMASLDESERERGRMMGRQLMALTLQYISNGEDERLVAEARRMGTEYGLHCQSLGMPLTDALQASIFFRDTMIETALQLPDNVRIQPEANVRLMRRINTLLNTVHLAIAEVYDAYNTVSGS
ncbi:MAG: helix-turn-helix domain-containing protein [Ardenticatenaceae bacterium]|nr:helix-turn-helix domain-containing protein [Ardenticatenaceae bacterium]